MTNNKFTGEYVSPKCDEFALVTEGSILTDSTGMVGEFKDNDIFSEEF
jgi:hypothetical protein